MMDSALEAELWQAVAEDDFLLVKYYLEKALMLNCDLGLDRAVWSEGWRSAPVHMAAWRGNNAILRILVELGGANVNSLVLHDAECPDGGGGDWETPLHVAARRGRADAVSLLLLMGADHTIAGRFSCFGSQHSCLGTPYDFARQRGRLECLKAFQAHGIIS